MAQHNDPHTCHDCGLCVCGCDDCGRIYCACPDCPCEDRHDHTDSECTHLDDHPDDEPDGDKHANPSWFEDVAFLPLDPAEADRQRVQRNAVGAVIAWDDIVAMYQKMLPQTLKPTDPRSWTPYIDRTDPEQVRAAHAALDAYEEHMARHRTHPLPPPTPRTEPWADTLIHYLRHLELNHAGIPPIGPRLQQRHPIARVHWTPRAYAALHGLTGSAADMFVEMAETLQRDHD